MKIIIQKHEMYTSPGVHGANFQKLASENKTSGLEHIDPVAQLPPRWDAGSS